ncbi:MAG: glutamine-hydrolyzing GMP synthase [Methanocellales archaeon]|nr:glutamine-hydrolyzing GMP synthase [Methanocellales archaeon]MDD3292049.1 glutamine-hydrolyzing GMP synthase [Methanocellales archaeon]MDD5235570.1 glutamine-hydrolyzing GMP synthase [Methanocellales archaeon]MDD5485594.1 glutamine-hydrolyzing GMP synthase [Methanocellales archaeon]
MSKAMAMGNQGVVSGQEKDRVVVLDFGGQYSHLIVRRCRELGVYTELLPYDVPIEELRRGIERAEGKIRGIILSGSPFCVHEPSSPRCASEIVALDVPILGICYGAQLLADMLGGVVTTGGMGEFGKTELSFSSTDLFEGVSETGKTTVWMSHSDVIERFDGADVIGTAANSPVAAFRVRDNIYGLQFHPEVHHTEMGDHILWNFLYKICKCERNWEIASFIEDAIAKIRKEVGAEGKVICGLSGGIDSSTTALLVNKAIGNRLTCIFVDTGLLREGERERVIKIFEKSFQIKLVVVDARKRFLAALKGVRDAEAKRRLIGELFIKVFEKEAKRIGRVDFLAQGTIYPDRIESAKATSERSSRIKSHHNVGALPERLGFKLIEPIKDLYKDEVREVAKGLGIPNKIIKQHPFPGPGLAARILGEVTEEKLRICRESSHIVEEELIISGWYDRVWQAFAVVGDDVATGVLGDARQVGRIVTIRVVESKDAMTADFVKLPYEVLERMSNRITNEVKGVTWVAYAISSKPPATIEPC